MTKAEKIKWLQGIECRLYYELDGQHLADVDKKNKYNRVNALLVNMINKYENRHCGKEKLIDKSKELW